MHCDDDGRLHARIVYMYEIVVEYDASVAASAALYRATHVHTPATASDEK